VGHDDTSTIVLPPPPASSSFLSDWWLFVIVIGLIAAAYRYLFPAIPAPTRNNRFNHPAMASSSSATPATAAVPRRNFTLSELEAFNGSDPSKPLYMGCNGLVFDVSTGRGFYGPGAAYGVFAGRDASRGLGKMEIQYNGADISDLSASEKQVMKDWSDKFQSKYPVVGQIVDDSQPNSGSQTGSSL